MYGIILTRIVCLIDTVGSGSAGRIKCVEQPWINHDGAA